MIEEAWRAFLYAQWSLQDSTRGSRCLIHDALIHDSTALRTVLPLASRLQACRISRHAAWTIVLLVAVVSPGRSLAQPTWQIRTPSTYGLSGDRLEAVFDRARDLAPLNSFLLARGDSLVAAQTYRGMTLDQPTNIKSASKSVLSALAGIAFADGALTKLQQPIGRFFPETLPDTSRKAAITLYHLLTMQAGLESTSFGNYGRWVTSDDWVTHALNRPLVHTPGDGMIYSTGTTHILAALLTKAVDEPLRDYAQHRLFNPLNVQMGSWQQDPDGIYFGGNNLALSPRGLLRFGQLYLNGGRWNGQQVLPRWWVTASWQPYVDKSYRGFKYGLLWWVEEFGDVRTYFAWGYGGQFVFVAPELDLVVAMTSSLSNRPSNIGDHSGQLFRFWEETVLPAVQGTDEMP